MKFIRNDEQLYNLDNDIENDNQSRLLNFLHIFNEDFLPWCLDGKRQSISLQLDLLLALLDEHIFREQWHNILSYVILSDKFGKSGGGVGSDQLEVLGMLLEKVRDQVVVDELHAEEWSDELLDKSVVSMLSSPAPLSKSHVRFLW